MKRERKERDDRARRGFRTRHILDVPPGERLARLLWRFGMAGAGASAFFNIVLHAFVYESKAWVATPESVACLAVTVVSMGVVVVGSLVRSMDGRR